MATTVAMAKGSPPRQACSSWLSRVDLMEGSTTDIECGSLNNSVKTRQKIVSLLMKGPTRAGLQHLTLEGSIDRKVKTDHIAK
jgi:hypothetical protein